MSQMSKRVIAKWCSLASLALVTLVLIILSWFYTTESGLQWLVARTTGFQPQTLQIGNVSGTLSTQIRLTELNWQQDKQNIQANGLTVNCQWLHLLDGLVSCESVTLTSLTLVNTSEKISDNQAQKWPELSTIKLPIKVKVKQISIANIHYQQLSNQGASTVKKVRTAVHNTEINNNASAVGFDNTHASEDSSYEIVTLKIANLALMRSKVSLGKLTAVFQEHNLSASGYVDMRKKWSHQLDVKVSGPSLVSNIKSKGDISQLSQLTLQLQEPQQLTITSDWFYNQGLFLKHGKLTANNQRVEIDQQTVVIEQAKATFDLDWPKLTSNLQAQTTWQTLENIQLEMNTDLADVLDWQSDSKITVQIKSELSEAQVSTSLQYVLPSDEEDKALANTKVDTKVLTKSQTKSQTKTANKWPILLKANIAVKQGMLSVNSDELTLGELSAVLQGEFKVNDPLAENLFLKAEIKGKSLALENNLNLENIDASWQIQKQQSTWVIASEGRINKLGLAKLTGENIRWSVDFSERWQADVQADLLRANDVDIEQLMLKITGLPEAHQVMLGANLADENRINLSFDGTFISDETAKLAVPLSTPLAITSELTDATWQISNLEFSALHQDERLLLSAEQLRLSREKQSISNLCLKGTGRFCVNAEHNIKQWTTNINFEQWSVSPVIEQLKTWQTIIPVALPKAVEGIVNGKVALSGQNSTVANVTANLTIPYVKWSSSDVEIAGQDIVINTLQQQQNNKKLDSQEKITLVTQWQRINTSLQLPEWPSQISMPEGRFLLSFSPDLNASAKAGAKTKTKASTNKEIKGSLKATPNLNYELDFDLQQSDIVLSIPDEKNDSQQVKFQHLLTFPLLNISGKWQQDKISSRLLMKLPAEDEISAQLSSEWPLTDSAKLSGEFAVNLQQFEWLKQWQKRIDKIDVSLVQSFTLAGSWQKPLLDGKGILDIKHLVVDEYGLDIRDSKVKITSQQDLITLTGELQNPQGSLTLMGKTKLSAPITADLTLEGQQVTLVNNSENKLIVSPKLTANYQNKHLKVDGHLVIDQADIKIASLPKSAVSVSEDQVIVNVKDSRLKDSAFDYNIALTISAGDNVKISGFGLSSAIRGDLSASLLSGQPIVLNGRLDLEDGKFEAYKQVLTIEQGQLLFLGAAENPSIQFRAVRVVDEIKVGIIADGTIHKPRLTLFSEPTLADENVLSLLITGRNLDSLSTQEGNALTSAAISLGVESANKVVQKIGDQLGLKDVAFTSKNGTNGGSTRVDLAAKINDRLNVGYGTSIDSDNSIQAGWNIEYKLSDNISFEATSGEEISANINYKKQYSPSKEKVTDKNK